MSDLDYEQRINNAPQYVGQVALSRMGLEYAIAVGTKQKSDWKIVAYNTPEVVVSYHFLLEDGTDLLLEDGLLLYLA